MTSSDLRYRLAQLARRSGCDRLEEAARALACTAALDALDGGTLVVVSLARFEGLVRALEERSRQP